MDNDNIGNSITATRHQLHVFSHCKYYSTLLYHSPTLSGNAWCKDVFGISLLTHYCQVKCIADFSFLL